MNLRFVRHIVLKDVRRLWWLIALTLLLLARLVHFDSWRGDATPGSDEGWLNILLPLAWSFLIALAVLEDPVVGETPFWATVPCRWTSLLAAKSAFIALVIHLPYFIACVWILESRGFPFANSLPDLLYRQLALLALTLTSLGLATTVRNVTQFMVCAVALATMVTAPSMSLPRDPAEIQRIREILALPVVAIAASWIAFAQYGGRPTSVSRLTGIGAILIAAIIWWLPRTDFYGIQAVLFSAPATAGAPSVRLVAELTPPDEIRGRSLPLAFNRASVAVPLIVSGLRNNVHARMIEPGPSIVDSGGARYGLEPTAPARGVSPCCTNMIPSWQILSIEPAVFKRIASEPVTLEGRMFVDYYRPAQPVQAALEKVIVVAGGPRCSANVPLRDNPSDEGLRVECESPDPLPRIQVKLSDPVNREWEQYLGSSYTQMSYPSGAWLSPVYRQETTLLLTDEEHYRPEGGRWAVPREVVRSVKIILQAEEPEGVAIVPYRIPDIRLNEFQVKQ